MDQGQNKIPAEWKYYLAGKRKEYNVQAENEMDNNGVKKYTTKEPRVYQAQGKGTAT